MAEWHVYGNEQQGRFLTVYPNRTYANTSNDPTQRVFYGAGLSEDITNNIFKRQLGNKAYELKDHLGNVRITFSDIKMPTAPYTTPFEVDLLSKSEYFPYGMQIEDLSYNAQNIAKPRYGYNGKEKDNEIKGESNSLDFGARIYDPRGARFLSQDPLKSQFAFQSPFIYAGDSPINSIDYNGLFKLSVEDKKLYPNLNEYLKNIKTEYYDKPVGFRKSFERHSQMNEEQINKMLTYDSGTEIKVQDLTSYKKLGDKMIPTYRYGLVQYNTDNFDENGNMIDNTDFISNYGEFGILYLDIDLVNKFEKPLRYGLLFDVVKKVVEATVFHEGTHVGDAIDNSYQYDAEGNIIETGEEFEKEIYSEPLQLPQP